jgi:hypothetical protein
MSAPFFRKPTWIVMVLPMFPCLYRPTLIRGSLYSEPLDTGPTFKTELEAGDWIGINLKPNQKALYNAP